MLACANTGARAFQSGSFFNAPLYDAGSFYNDSLCGSGGCNICDGTGKF